MLQIISTNFLTDIKTVPPSYTMRHFHEHNRWELFLLVSGNCTLYLGKEIYHIESGSIVLIPAGCSHKTTYLPGTEHCRYLFYFDADELDWLKTQISAEAVKKLEDSFVIHIPAKRIGFVQDLISKIAYESHGLDSFSLPFNRTYFYELILFLLRCQLYRDNIIQRMDISNEIIQNVIEYIINHYNTDITLAETARFFHMSESSLSKKFKAFTGYRFKEYVVHVRTQAAADALLNTSLSITEIAVQCGFSDSNTFGDTFKKVFHVSPSNYRKRC